MKESMVSFRKSRSAMGFKHTSAYIPNSRIADFSIYVERLKAERMMEICEEPTTSVARTALSQCNYVEVPNRQELQAMMERNKEQREIVKQCKLALDHAERFNAASMASRMTQDEDDYIKWQSIAVANSSMAAVIWREIIFAVQEAETGGRVRKEA